MKLQQTTQAILLTAILSLVSPSTCTAISEPTSLSFPEPSSLPSTSTANTTTITLTTSTAKPTATQPTARFGMIVRESGAITISWRRCGEGLSRTSSTPPTASASVSISISTSSSTAIDDLEVFPTIIDDPTGSSTIVAGPTSTAVDDVEVFPTIIDVTGSGLPTSTVVDDLEVFPTIIDVTSAAPTGTSSTSVSGEGMGCSASA